MSQEGFERLSDAMDKLTLNDASVTVRKESSIALGPGFRCGFLGMLHMDVFMQRLMDEHGSEVLCALAVTVLAPAGGTARMAALVLTRSQLP